MHSVSWVVCGSCQVHECPALELVQIVGKPASRAPSVQGTARPSIWVSPELSIPFHRSPLSAKMVIVANSVGLMQGTQDDQFPRGLPHFGEGAEKGGEGAEGFWLPHSLPGGVATPALLDVLIRVRPLPGLQDWNTPEKPEGKCHWLCWRDKKQEAGLMVMVVKGQAGEGES